jgi:hypothetical protein
MHQINNVLGAIHVIIMRMRDEDSDDYAIFFFQKDAHVVEE